MSRPKRATPYLRESDLCAAFIAAVSELWVSYAETGDWDILLVRKADGFQIGIQAKLKLNAYVLAQAVEQSRYQRKRGPDCRAILVPYAEVNVGLQYLCAYIGITIIRMEAPPEQRRYRTTAFSPRLPKIDGGVYDDEWYDQCPTERHRLPEYVPDVQAGVPSPATLSQWKVGALKIEALLERNGAVTREDFKAAGVDHRRWTAKANGWLVPKDGRYIRGPHLPDFKAQHPVVYQRVKDDHDKWMKQRAEAQAPLL